MPVNASVTLASLGKAASALGRMGKIELVPEKFARIRKKTRPEIVGVVFYRQNSPRIPKIDSLADLSRCGQSPQSSAVGQLGWLCINKMLAALLMTAAQNISRGCTMHDGIFCGS